MKDLGETLSLTNGSTDDAAVLLNGGVTSLSRSSSCSSVDLHLAEDTDEDTDDRNDSESVHDPNTNKLSATGASFINMYKDSSKKYLEIVNSHCKEIDSSMVESTACSKPNLVKIDGQWKRVDSKNSDAKHADEPEKDVEACLKVTADVNETVGNNTLDDVSQPVTVKEPTKMPTNKCNSSSLEAAARNKGGSLTNGALKAVTESNSLEAKAISIDTPLTVVAEPLKTHIVEKESKHLDAKTSLEQKLNFEMTSLVKNNAIESSMDSSNVSCQVWSETITSKPSDQDCKEKEKLQRTAGDKEVKEDCRDMEELHRTDLGQTPEEAFEDKEELQRTALNKESDIFLKINEELQRTALDEESDEDWKEKVKEEWQTSVLDKKFEEDCMEKVNEEWQTSVLDKELEEDCKENVKQELQITSLDKEPEEYCKVKDEFQKNTLDKEPEEDSEVQITHLNKECEEDCKDKEELQRAAFDKPEEYCKDKEELQRTDLDKEPEDNCKVNDELQRAAFDKEPEEDDKEELQRSPLDKEIEHCKVTQEVQRSVLDKHWDESCKDDVEVQKIAMDKEIEEVCKDKEEVHTVALNKEIQEVCKDMDEGQSVALDKETLNSEVQSNESCDAILPKEKSEGVGSFAQFEKSENSVTTTAHSVESDHEELTPILDIVVVDKELHSKPNKLVENVGGIDLKTEPECYNICQEVESESLVKLDVVTANCSVKTEQSTQKVEDVAAVKSDETVLTCTHKDYSVVEFNESNSAKEDDAVEAHVPEEEESVSSDVDSEAVVANADTLCLDGSVNDQNRTATITSVDLLKITSESTFIDLCDSAEEPDNCTPGEPNVCADDSRGELTIDLDKHNDEAGTAPKSEIEEDVDKAVSTTEIAIEENVESSDSVDMETDATSVKYDVGACVQVQSPSPPTDGNKGNSTFDMLLKDEINKTSESITCKKQVGKAQQSQADVSPMTKENDVSTADIQGSSVSTDRDNSSGFSIHGQKRMPSTDDPIETKKAKLTNGYDTEVITNSRKDVASIDLTNEKTCAKRVLEFSDGLESKKARVLLVDESSSNSCGSTMSNEHVSKKCEEGIAMEESSTVPAVPRKPLSNIDKAIERVAFAGLDRKERVMMPFIKDLKNRRLHDITIDDLEELVTQRMGEVLSETGENGVLREKVQKLEKMTEFWKHKATSLQKQLSDMTMVFKKLATETKQNSNQMQIPIKITRSVGLQVIMPSLQSVHKSNATHVRNGLSPGTKRKTGGIVTNRNATTPTVHYPSPTAMSPNRTPVVQKVITPATVKLPQAVTAPKPPVVTPPPAPPAVRFRSPTTTVASSATGTVMTVAGNLRTAASIAANRPVVKSVTPRSAPPPGADTLIDLTDEDDRTRRVTSNPLGQQLRVAQLNGSPPTLGSTIRFSPSQQLTGIATGANGQRLAYMLPASAANAASGRLQLFTQQTGGNLRPSGLLTVRPSTQTQTLMLKNGAVVSSAASPSSVMRAGATGTFQQVVARPGQMRTIQPAGRPVAALPPPLHTQHPAPLPPPPPEFPSNPSWKKPPPRPDLKISKVDNREQHGIILSWNMDHGTEHEEIASYQLYAYQENNSPPSTSQWKKVGDVKAMPLPMACTLTQFLEGNKYHFAVRAIDIHSRSGLFSIPGHIILPRRGS